MRIIEEPRAPNPRRVRIFLAEKGISIPSEPLSINKHEHKSDAFRRVNPLQQVPVLVLDDDTVITESVAICRYFEELQPDPPLFGVGARERADVEMWNRRVEHGLFQAVAHCFRHSHPMMAELERPQIPAWGEINRERARAFLRTLDGELADRQFLAGPRFTIADITLLVAIDFMRPPKIERPAGLAHLDRWYAEVAARPSAKG